MRCKCYVTRGLLHLYQLRPELSASRLRKCISWVRVVNLTAKEMYQLGPSCQPHG
jgi:hypothetical protein